MAYDTQSALQAQYRPEEVKKNSQVEGVLAELSIQIERYRESIDRLCVKISGVLPPPVPEKVSVMQPPMAAALCPLAGAIDLKVSRIRENNNQLCDIISSIQL